MKLSKEHISSFVGDVVTLELLTEDGEAGEEICFYAEPAEAVFIRRFTGDRGPAMPGRTLVVLKQPGEATIYCRVGRTTLQCTVHAHPLRRATAEQKLHYYVGDFHSHTSLDHNEKTFPHRTDGLPAQAVAAAKAEGGLDFFTLSDHGTIIDDPDFYRTMKTAEEMTDSAMIVFGGVESENTLIERDDYGLSHKNAGETVTFLSDNYAPVESWEEYFHRMGENPYAIGTFAHPQVLGYDENGIWNFCFKTKGTPQMRRFFRLLEVFNGTRLEQNLFHELAYSVALDAGFRVSPILGSDSHGPKYGDPVCAGKSVIMATEKSKEAFIDAILAGRVYATESGNVKLHYTVNGTAAPATLKPSPVYHFHVQTAALREGMAPDRITELSVISNGGLTVYWTDAPLPPSFDFTVSSDTASYFYLRLVDENGKRTISAPVYTGRPLPALPATDSLRRLDKSDFTCTELSYGTEAQTLVCADPTKAWIGMASEAELEIDMHVIQDICGVGLYSYRLLMQDTLVNGKEDLTLQYNILCSYAQAYEIYTAIDREDYTLKAVGSIRIYGGEEISCFPKHLARYIRVRLLNTVGDAFGNPRPIRLGEIDVFA